MHETDASGSVCVSLPSGVADDFMLVLQGGVGR